MATTRSSLLRRLVTAGPYAGRYGWLRGVALALGAAAFMTFSGAFATGEAPLLVRAIYWPVLMLAGTLWGSFVMAVLFPDQVRKQRPWVSAVGAAVVMAVPFTAVVVGASNLAFGRDVRSLPSMFLVVLGVCLTMTVLNVVIESGREDAPAPPVPAGGPTPVRFLERLPPRLRGGTLWAVQSDDHYLRLHTSRGQDLILMRPADAVAELEGLEGAQVHRSWWVSRQAIADARRGDGRATLVLPDGAVVPVSRTYAPELRRQGWI